MKRTTGIPRSFLKTVEKPSQIANDGTIDDTKQPPGVMVDADGEWVIAEPDQASWDQYQAKTKLSAAAQEAAARGSKELQDLGLECPIDRRLFTEPTKTPCCQRVYCLECITNSLLENNLRCPHCDTENILLDDLKVDVDMNRRVHEFEQTQLASKEQKPTDIGAEAKRNLLKDTDEAVEKEDLADQQLATEQTAGKSPVKDTKSTPLSAVTPRPLMPSSAPSNEQSMSKKRAAESELPNIRLGVHPGSERAQDGPRGSSSGSINPSLSSATGNAAVAHGMGPMVFPHPSGFMNMPMTMAPSLMYNPLMMANSLVGGGGNNWNTAWGQNYSPQGMGASGSSFSHGSIVGGNFGNTVMPVSLPMPTANGFGGFNGMASNGQGNFPFLNQQRNQFGRSNGSDEESAYFRKPINPHRHQARRNMSRPTDYHEI